MRMNVIFFSFRNTYASIIRATCVFDTKIPLFDVHAIYISPYAVSIKKNFKNSHFSF